MSRLRIGSLFTGYGGLDMAAQQVLGGELVWVADNGAGPSKVLACRHPGVPNLGDISLVDWATVPPVDILTGGSPCQDLSTAGRRAGMTEGTRSNLWVVMREAIAHVRPKLVIWENVRGALSAGASSAVESEPGLLGDRGGRPALRALGRVVGDLADLGYVGRWVGLRVADLGGCHGRFRIFLVAWPADSDGPGLQGLDHREGPSPAGRHGHAEPGAGGPGLTLLRTPTAQLAVNGGSQHPDKRKAGGHGPTLADEVEHLLPTPAACKPNDGEPICGCKSWGQFAPAVHSHERLAGRSAPPPTEPGPGGKPRLSPRAVEFMMCLPDGWVTAVPGVTRTEQLALLGNGVIPPQAVAALLHLLA